MLTVDAQSTALGNLLLIQHALEVLPNETSIASFLCRSLSTIPGVKDVHVCIRGVITPDDAMYRELCRAWGANGSSLVPPPLMKVFPLRTSHQIYGVLFLCLNSEDQFSPYQPYLANTANTVATLLESRDHVHQLQVANERVERGRDELETKVKERTAELTTKNVELELEVRERKRAEDLLKESQERLRLALDAAQIGDWELDLVTQQTNRSLRHGAIFGQSQPLPEWDTKAFQAHIHPDDRSRVELAMKESVATGQDWRDEFRIIRDDKTVRWIWARSHVFKDPQGQPSKMHGMVSDITENKKTETALRDKTIRLQTLSRRVLETQETERRRVAHELHDELGQALTAIKINLQTRQRFQKQLPDEVDTENLRIVDDALQQVRRLALALRPSMLDDLGLLPALRWIAEQTATRSSFAVQFDTTIPEVRLAPEIETACFRIVQEALTNIARHAQAQRVEIGLHRTGDALVLFVQDDGCGFDLATMRGRAVAGGSIGVLGMQERAELIGGQLVIESALGQGSTVRLRCPLRRREDAP